MIRSRYSLANLYTHATSVVRAYAQKTGSSFYWDSKVVHMRRRQDLNFIGIRSSSVCAKDWVGMYTLENTGWCSFVVRSRYSPANSYTHATSMVCAYRIIKRMLPF